MRYVKRNALQGRDEELTCWEDYGRLAIYWRNEVANVRVHDTTKERPVDRFRKEQSLLRPLPAAPFDTDEMVSVVVNSHARVHFDGNRYSVPPELARKTALLRANAREVRVLYQGRQLACHPRSYDRGQLICHPDHQLEALKMRRRVRSTEVENQFDALGEEAKVPSGTAPPPGQNQRPLASPADVGAGLRPSGRGRRHHPRTSIRPTMRLTWRRSCCRNDADANCRLRSHRGRNARN